MLKRRRRRLSGDAVIDQMGLIANSVSLIASVNSGGSVAACCAAARDSQPVEAVALACQ